MQSVLPVFPNYLHKMSLISIAQKRFKNIEKAFLKTIQSFSFNAQVSSILVRDDKF